MEQRVSLIPSRYLTRSVPVRSTKRSAAAAAAGARSCVLPVRGMVPALWDRDKVAHNPRWTIADDGSVILPD
jgi:hypothetical protein